MIIFRILNQHSLFTFHKSISFFISRKSTDDCGAILTCTPTAGVTNVTEVADLSNRPTGRLGGLTDCFAGVYHDLGDSNNKSTTGSCSSCCL